MMCRNPSSISPRLLWIGLSLCFCFSAACNRGRSGGAADHMKRYSLKGTVISVDKNAGTANLSNEPIPGFMEAMVMPYSVKPASTLDQLRPGDSIIADVVVGPNQYWLENVKVTGHAQLPASEKPTASLHTPQPGEQVPDFQLINQNAQQISLRQYRGETLLLTLVYTRCPFPDFCPRVSHEFAAIDKEVLADPARYGKTHLLSVSFDPAHDTPKVLRAYGFSCAGSKDPALFRHWEFAAIPKAELPKFANYFALTLENDDGLITHSLSTTVISPDGKIYRWYHGADWQATDLLQDLAASHAAS